MLSRTLRCFTVRGAPRRVLQARLALPLVRGMSSQAPATSDHGEVSNWKALVAEGLARINERAAREDYSNTESLTKSLESLSKLATLLSPAVPHGASTAPGTTPFAAPAAAILPSSLASKGKAAGAVLPSVTRTAAAGIASFTIEPANEQHFEVSNEGRSVTVTKISECSLSGYVSIRVPDPVFGRGKWWWDVGMSPVLPSRFTEDQYVGCSNSGEYGWSLSTFGNLYPSGVYSGLDWLKPGDVVRVRLDTTGSAGKLTFLLNGKEAKKGHDDLPVDKELWLTVSLFDTGESVTIVDSGTW